MKRVRRNLHDEWAGEEHGADASDGTVVRQRMKRTGETRQNPFEMCELTPDPKGPDTIYFSTSDTDY